METTLTPAAVLQQRWGTPWLIGAEVDSFWSQLEQLQAEFAAARPRDVLLAEPHPVKFLAAFFAAVQQPCRVWLANPQWGAQEWQQVAAQCQPDWVIGHPPEPWGNFRAPVEARYIAPLPPDIAPRQPEVESQILIPTGGSSGNIRFAVHTWETLSASVWGFCQYFGGDRINAYCVLPLYHVSGLMQALRCFLSGGTLVIQPFQQLLQAGAITPPSQNHFLSLVPTQLQRLLTADWDAVPWLRQFNAILLGGAPLWPSLRQTARDLKLPLAPTYGMTETASQVVTLRPAEFLAGKTGSGRVLPHAAIAIRDDQGTALPPCQVGQIGIVAESLALAYGDMPLSQPFQTQDLGYLDAAGFLHVVGRAKTLIMTGGEKVLPEEVEAAILATGLVQDVAVLGLPDADWGEKVVAVVTKTEENTAASGSGSFGQLLRLALKANLSPYKIPKQWWVRSRLPRNAQGKLNRAALRQWVLDQVGSTAATTESTPASGDGVGE